MSNEEEDALFEIARQAPEGDLRAFESLVQSQQRRIVANCRQIIRDDSVAEDLAQEVFVKAYFGMRSFEGRSSFGHWLRVIKVHHCLNFVKKRNRGRTISLEDEDPNSGGLARAISSDDKSLERLTEGQIIHKILKIMPETLRLPLVLRDMDELSYEEVAEQLDISLSAAKMRIKRGREFFRDQYEAHAVRAQSGAV